MATADLRAEKVSNECYLEFLELVKPSHCSVKRDGGDGMYESFSESKGLLHSSLIGVPLHFTILADKSTVPCNE